MRSPGHKWPPEHDELLKARYEEGDSFSDIAAALLEKFDIVLSRNACIGRAHRMGLKSDSKPGEGRKVKRNKTRSSRIADSKGGALAAKASRSGAVIRPSAFLCRDASDVEPLHIDLMQLTEGVCHWPYGEHPPFAFCGQPATGSYCTAHSRIVYVPARKETDLTEAERERRRYHGERMKAFWAGKRMAAC